MVCLSHGELKDERMDGSLTAQDMLGDDSASWCKAFSHVMASSIKNNKVQPLEIAGDGMAKVCVSVRAWVCRATRLARGF